MPSLILRMSRRLRLIPKRILLVSGLLVISPIFNILHILFPYGWNRFQWSWIDIVFTPGKILFIFFPILVAIGLLYKARWAFIGWMIYSLSLFSYNSFVTWNHPTGINFSILFQSLILISLVPWVLHEDISSPYFSRNKGRGWRRNHRIPWEKVYYSDGGLEFKSINKSRNGILFHIQDSVKIALDSRLSLSQDRIVGGGDRIEGTIVRMNENSFFLSFVKVRQD